MPKDNQTLQILIGIPGSGKSTWAKDFCKYNAGWVRVSRDDFRLMLKQAQMCEPKIEDLVTILVDETIKQALFKKENVIVDATNVKASYIQRFIDNFQNSADIKFRIFDISVDKAIERDKNREATVGEAVIRKMYKDYQVLIDSFPLQDLKRTSHRNQLKPNEKGDAIIVDIDGTLTFMSDRDPYDYDKVYKDEVNPLVADIVKAHKAKGHKVILLTGRDEESRKVTVEWLDLYEIPYDVLYMRKDGDYRKDSVVKKEIYYNEIEPNSTVICAYDDRLSVLEMWYEIGIYTFNVNQGNILF